MAIKLGSDRDNAGMAVRSGALAFTAALAVIVAPAAGHGAGEAGTTGASPAVIFEDIPATGLKRVILTERAAQRLGIELGEVTETEIIHTQMVGGRIVMPAEQPLEPATGAGGFAGFAVAMAAPAATTAQEVAAPPTPPEIAQPWVLLTLSPDEWDRTKQDAPARVTRLQTREGEALRAMPAGLPPKVDRKRTMLGAYYVISGGEAALRLHERVRVELQLKDTDQTRKVVPYSAVYYDGAGKAWVYASPAPLTYERMPIDIDRVDGDLAVLKAGPPLGTAVVTVGAPLLYGAEVIYKR